MIHDLFRDTAEPAQLGGSLTHLLVEGSESGFLRVQRRHVLHAPADDLHVAVLDGVLEGGTALLALDDHLDPTGHALHLCDPGDRSDAEQCIGVGFLHLPAIAASIALIVISRPAAIGAATAGNVTVPRSGSTGRRVRSLSGRSTASGSSLAPSDTVSGPLSSVPTSATSSSDSCPPSSSSSLRVLSSSLIPSPDLSGASTDSQPP
jgi:hypothetical protein